MGAFSFQSCWGASRLQPPDIQVDRYLMQAEEKIGKQDFAAAKAALGRILDLQEEHGLEIPEAFYFRYAEVLERVGLYEEAIEAVTSYLTMAGRDGERYREALRLLNSVEAKKDNPIAGMEFVRITAGEFLMSLTSTQALGNERPVMRARISRAFDLGKYEVTQGQWEAVMGNTPSAFEDCGSDCPVEWVSWNDAQGFIGKLDARGEGWYLLPTEAEWEYAARAGTTRDYYSANLDAIAWYSDNSERRTHPIGQKAPNALATITIQEGFSDAIMSMAPASTADDDVAAAVANSDSLVVTFTGIPEGVMVMVPAMVEVGMIDDPAETANAGEMILDPATFSLTLEHGTRTDGVEDVEDGMGAVELTASGAGEVVYNVGMTDGAVNEEWVKLMVTFVWKAGGEMPAGVGSGYVDVSFSPVSNMGGDTFEDGGAKLPRFVASNGPDMVVNVGDCTTTLLYPFVPNQLMFDTGLVITNTSEEAGSCTIEYNGSNAPGDLMSQPIAGGAQWIDLLSRIANGFQGYITATCGFRDGYGFAFLTDGYGGTPELAQSYLAVCTAGAHCE